MSNASYSIEMMYVKIVIDTLNSFNNDFSKYNITFRFDIERSDNNLIDYTSELSILFKNIKGNAEMLDFFIFDKGKCNITKDDIINYLNEYIPQIINKLK